MSRTKPASKLWLKLLFLVFFGTLLLNFCVEQTGVSYCYADQWCRYDKDEDHDVDGKDLASLATGSGAILSHIADIAAEYGLQNCTIPFPPHLSILSAPETITVKNTAVVQFAFTDQNQDIEFLNISQSNDLGDESVKLEAQLIDISGPEGTRQIELNTSELPFGPTEIQLQLQDSAGLLSDPIQFTITIAGESTGGTPPSLSNMSSLALVQNRPTGRFDTVLPLFNFTYSDPEENIDRLRVRLIPPVGEATLMEKNAAGLCCQAESSESTQSFFTFRDTSPLGEYKVELTLFDLSGQASNTVNASVHLVADGGSQSLSINSFSPAEGPAGTQVLLSGSGFDTAQIENHLVEINQVPCKITAATDTALTIVIPEDVDTGAFSVKLGSKMAWSDTVFTIPAAVTLTPSMTNLVVNASVQFDVRIISAPDDDATLVWYVNNIQGGDETTGTITQKGFYTAPSEVPPEGEAVVKAVLNVDPNVTGQSIIKILPPLSLPGKGMILSSMGGLVKSRNGMAAVNIPADALSQNTDITVDALSGATFPPPPNGNRIVGGATFGPLGTIFNHSVDITLPLIRFYSPGTQLNTLVYDPAEEIFLDEGIVAIVGKNGSQAMANVLHFSTYIIVDDAPETQALEPPEIIDASPASGLEGTKIPVLLQGNYLTSDLQVDVFLDGVPNLEDIIPGAIYTLGETAGLLLDIQTITDLDAGNTQTYTIRLKRFGSAPGEQETFFDLTVQGLNELNLLEGSPLELSNPGEVLYSEVFIGGTLLITSGSIHIRSTGPVNITGIINAKGKDGETTDSQMGAPGGEHGGDGGQGREDNDCLFGGFCPESENYGQNGNDCIGFPEIEEQGFCRPLTGSGKTIPKGLGGAPGTNIGFDIQDIFGLGSCALGPVPTCIAAVIATIDAATSVADIADGSVTGKRGFGAVLVSDLDETGGGGGGGGGRIAIGVGSYFPGGGGGGGGDGGRDVSIVTPDEIILSHGGIITTEGGNGGNGSSTTLFHIPIPGAAPVPVPALPGGGGGGGSGGYLEIASGKQIAVDSERNQLRFGGGQGGSGGVTIVDPENGNLRVAFKANYASNGPTLGWRRSDPLLALGSPIFDPNSIDTMVTNRTLFPVRFGASGFTATIIVENEAGSQSFEFSKSDTESNTHFEGNILLSQGFNKVSIIGMDDDLLKKQILVLAVDSDGDGLSDSDEIILGTDPERPDTDNDGLNDKDEVIHHKTDPLQRDSDQDGLTDFQEITETGTDPNDPDTDKDGFKDSLEIFLNSLPLNQYDTPDTIPEGTVYAVATNMSGTFLALLDPQTGSLGLAGQPGGVFGLALGKSALYTADGSTLSTNHLLQDISIPVGPFKDIDGNPIIIRHIAYNRVARNLNGVYGVELGPGPDYPATGQLVQVNSWSATATRIGTPLADPIRALEFTNEGLLFAVLEGNAVSNRFVKLDPSTGAITDEIGMVGVRSIFGMAFLQTGELIASNRVSDDSTQLITINLSTGVGTYLSDIKMAVSDLATPYGCIPVLFDSCGDEWSCPKLISAGGYSPDLAIDGSNTVHVTHARSESGYWGDFDSLTFGYWESGHLCGTETIESSTGKGYYSSLAIDPSTGDLHTSYGPAGLSYAKKEAATGLWTYSPVDESSGEGTSIAIDQSSHIHISSFVRDWGPGPDQLIYATNKSGGWEFTTIDNDVYYYGDATPSMDMDKAGNAHIVYYDGGTQDLMYATNASGVWTVSTIDGNNTEMIGIGPDLVIDLNDALHVCYRNVTSSELKYATSQDVIPGSGNCGSGQEWNCEVVGPGDGDTSIAVDSVNTVNISYSNSSNLSHARRDPATKTWLTDTVLSTGSWQLDIAETSIAVDSGGKAHIVYAIVDYGYDFTPYEADLYYVREK